MILVSGMFFSLQVIGMTFLCNVSQYEPPINHILVIEEKRKDHASLPNTAFAIGHIPVSVCTKSLFIGIKGGVTR